MNFVVVAPQSSHWEDSHRAAAILVKALRRIGHEAWLVTSVYHDGEPAVDPEVVEKSEEGFVEVEKDVSGVPTIRVLSAKSMLSPGAVTLRSFSKILAAIDRRRGVDAVVVFSSFWNGPEEAAKWVTIKKMLAQSGEVGRPPALVYIPIYPTGVHGISPVEAVSRSIWSTLNLPHILRQAAAVVVSCREEVEAIRQLRAPADRIIEGKWWIDPDYPEALAAAGRLPHLEGFELVVSYAGPLTDEKNVRALVKLAERMPQVAVAVVGRGEAAAWLRREAARRRNLVLMEDPSAVVPVAKSSLLGVDLSIHEPMGIRALEYLYAGTPYAASPTSRAACHITDGVDGARLRNPEDLEGVARLVSTLAKKPELREEMGRHGRRKTENLLAIRLAETLVARLK
ncbi:glycosyltransferase [Pyrobaculum sp. 3827-6]|uniref:glycosyltransferase n=1 Tax=Pyrobaculum sp. 3827-6 TaxID=2983604 RepID=UPI0021DB6C25|nr:glycosyltransferase [Pyrobaculum sp. 3827-6]MCU7786789.1 glycosyltransferase [Pyrobaculum sp. 3827-6]